MNEHKSFLTPENRYLFLGKHMSTHVKNPNSKTYIGELLSKIMPTLSSEIKESEFCGVVESFEITEDRYNRINLWLNVLNKKYGRVLINLSPIYIKLMAQYLTKLGILALEDMVGKSFKFEKIALQRARQDLNAPYPRFVPTDFCKE